jgi:hypothetical protein
MMGIVTTFLRFWNHQAQRIAAMTIKNLKKIESEDRARISDRDAFLYILESLLNRLEFSRPICVKKDLQKKGAAGDALLSNLLLQFT